MLTMQTLYDRLVEAVRALGMMGAVNKAIAEVTGLSSGRITQIKTDPRAQLGEEAVARLTARGFRRDWIVHAKGPMRIGNVDPGPDITGKVPVISWVRAGSWDEAVDMHEPGEAEEWLYYARKNGDNVFGLRVRGDSMTAPHGKTYPDGCVIFVDPEKRSPVNGDRIIAKLDGAPEVTFKVFVQDAGRTWLKPLNPQHPAIMEPFRVIGTVVGKWEDE